MEILMADPAETPKPMYPGHSWGKLAADPWLRIGSDSEECRAVLRRYWVRNGGTEEFERLVPPPDVVKRTGRRAM